MANPHQHTGLNRIIRATGYSWAGLKACWNHEEAFRQETLLAVVLIPLALWLGESGVEKALMIGTVIIVLITELLNSSIEATVDRFGGEHHELAGRAKDVASAAVTMSLILVVVTWATLLLS